MASTPIYAVDCEMNIGAWPQWFPVDGHHFSDLNAELDDADDLRQRPAFAAVQDRNRKCVGFAVGTDPDGGLIDQIPERTRIAHRTRTWRFPTRAIAPGPGAARARAPGPPR